MEPGPDAAEDRSRTSGRPKTGKVHALVLAISALGLALRLWGIYWSLPDARHPLATYHPDELVNLNAAVQVDIPHGKFDIGFYNYGAFYFYLVSFAQTFGRGYHLIPQTSVQPDASLSSSETDALVRQAPEQAGLFLAGRLVTALLGTATIAIVFALANRLYGSRTGVFAALLYAIAPLAVVHAHFLTVDVPATFFVTLALLWAARLHTAATRKDVILAGVWCGLAAATKYNTVLVLVAPLIALFLAYRSSVVRTAESEIELDSDEPGNAAVSEASLLSSEQTVTSEIEIETRSSSRLSQSSTSAGKWGARGLILSTAALLGVTLIVFLIACPGPWLNWNAFWNGTYPGSGVRYELLEHARMGHGTLFINTGPGWWYHLVVSLRYGLGWPLLLLSLGGVGFAVAARKAADWILLGFLIVFYFATGLSAVRFARYLIPLYPVLCVLGARLVTNRFDSKAVMRFAMASGTLVVLYTAVYSSSLVRAMALRDPRDSAADYIETSAPPNASVAFAHIPWFFSPPLSPLWGALRSDVRARSKDQPSRFRFYFPTPEGRPNTVIEIVKDEWDTALLSPLPDYVILSNLETNNDIGRLKMERPIQFMSVVQKNYRPLVFPPASVPGLSPATEAIPEDLLYILPVITVYKKQ